MSEQRVWHISDLTRYLRCPRLFRLDQDQGKAPFQQFLRMDEKITDLAMEKLGVAECFMGKRGDEPGRALEALEHNEWLVKARFEYHGLRIKVPFLHRSASGWDVYFLLVGLVPRALSTTFYTAVLWVLEGCGITINGIRIIHLNGDYIRGRELNTDELFVISECFYNEKNRPAGDIETVLRERRTDYGPVLEEMDRLMEGGIPEAVRRGACTGRIKCRFFDDCFGEGALPDNSIIHLTGAQHRYRMFDEGRQYLRDADPLQIEGTAQQYAEIAADRCGGLFADREALRTWLSDVQYPLSFIDFEWERFAVPPYEGMRPYDVLLFEYALNIVHEDGRQEHKVFLDVHDDREALVKSLLENIPETGTIIAYNAIGAEMMRIEELAVQLPAYAERLRALNSRMKDLQQPFESGLVYDVRMRGQWSLKTIMSLMDDPGYKDLDIRHGMDAVYQWRYLDRGTPDIDTQKIVEELKAYCGMDSYAMTVVYRWLCTLAGL